MSNQMPPPYQPGQPGQPGQPEYLGPEPTATSGRGRRTALIAGGVVGAVAVVGGGAWAASWYLDSGSSATDVLPAATLGYVEVNLDPSGSQKIAALETLNKFPAFKSAGLGVRDDLREKLVEAVQDDGTCPGISYSSDIAPWLGDRLAVAAVDEGGDEPVGVAVLEVTDEDKAETGLQKLNDCGGGTDVAYVLQDGWAVLAETKDEAQQALDLAEKGTLADDDDYQGLMDATGADGVLSAYVAPEAGDLLSELTDSGMFATGGSSSQAEAALKDFGGAAMQLRFADSGLEVGYAVRGKAGDVASSSDGVDAVTGLPASTGAAFGAAIEPGWGDDALDSAAQSLGTSRQELVDQIEQATGLTVPADVETLLGDSFAVALSSEIDVDAVANSSDPSSVPAGLRILGDPDQVESVLAKLRDTSGQGALLESTADGDRIGVGPDTDWNAALAAEGSLGDSSTFQDVVPDAGKASVIGFLDADGNGGWLVKALKAAGADQETLDNLEPLKAIGLQAWADGDLMRGQLRITTD